MRLSKIIPYVFLLLYFSEIYAQEIIPKGKKISVNLKRGLNLESSDKNLKLKIGGRIQYDYAFFSQSSDLEATYPLETKNGTQFRRVWLSNTAKIYDNVDFGLSISFENGRVGLRGVYIGINKVPVIGNIRVGQLKEPIRLEISTSSNHTLFMERSFDVDFAPIFNNGILIYNDFIDKKLSAQIGFFRNADLNKANDRVANDGYNITVRTTGLPFRYNNSFLHIGGSFSYRKPNTKTYRVGSRPESHLTDIRYIDTGVIEEVDLSNLTNFEILYAIGSFSFQGEYLLSDIKRTSGSTEKDLNFSTFYSQISYCITGENRTYKSSLSGLSPVKPNRNFGKGKNYGSLELAFKYSHSDLNDEDVFGGEQNDFTLGLNWYLNPLTKVMFNNTWANIVDEGRLNIFQIRFQVGF